MLKLIVPICLFLSLSVASANGLSCIYILTGDKVRYSPLAMIYGGADIHPRSQMYALTSDKKLQAELPEKFHYNQVVENGKTAAHEFLIQVSDANAIPVETMHELGIKTKFLEEKSDANEVQVHIEFPTAVRMNELLGLEVGKTPISFLAVGVGLTPLVRARFLSEGIVPVAADEIHALAQASYTSVPGFFKLSHSKFWPRLKSMLNQIFRDIDLGNKFSQNLNTSLTHNEKIKLAENLLLAAENTAVLMSQKDLTKIQTVRNLMSVMTATEEKLMRAK